jgi:hypothetical protein
VLSSEVFVPGPDRRARQHAPLSCLEELTVHGYAPTGGWR